MQQSINDILRTIVHPETGENLVDGAYIRNTAVDGGRITVELRYRKARDPFAAKLQRQIREALAAAYPEAEVEITEIKPEPRPQPEKESFTGGIRHVIALGSGKGGVGKSTVTANLAVTLRDMGYRVGVLDADIYGPSQPRMFGCEGYIPEAYKGGRDGNTDIIVPVEVQGIKLMSIGFFIGGEDALLWRGPMAVSALRQLVNQVGWGELDYLLIDLPPGTGDIHLSIISEIGIEGAIAISTPQRVAVMDMVRYLQFFNNQQVGVPVIGIIENMAWFTPKELPDNRYYLFGRGGAAETAAEKGIDFLGEIPIIQSIMEYAEAGEPAVTADEDVRRYYRAIGEKIVQKCG